MTKQEAKKLLYVFLKRHNIANQYYYNCVVANKERCANKEEYFKLPGREFIKRIINEHCDKFFSFGPYSAFPVKRLNGFFNYASHSFHWDYSEEGYDYWEHWHKEWEKEIGNERLYEMIND